MRSLKLLTRDYKEITMKNKLLLLTVCSGLLLSCSKSGGGGGSKATSAVPTIAETSESEMAGTYQAVFAPLNTNVSGHLNGSLTIVKEKNDFIADVRFSEGPASTLHTQTIHVGNRCPTLADDLNADGWIDGEELAQVVKEILIPLDDDISSQRMGLGTYPAADEFGYYFWSRATTLDKLMEDLHEEDINLTDDYVKLGNVKSLSMLGKVVVISGVPTTTPLPETVIGRGRMTPHQALPVACGVIRKLESVPGVIDTDITSIPVPGGESIGGSSGADDGAVFPPTDMTTTGGNYGDDRETNEEVITRTNDVNP
jgi:hypothetical protein